MPVVSPEKLIALQRAPDDVRNICILAHVDHGKTSLTDALIATNGIISPKLAGKVRYLDSRPDEQLRGITMESSAISLYFSLLRRNAPNATPEPKEYLINLIDSPGHIDFSSEVSTASRLSDGAVVLVDAVEGVCSQTVTALRLTWVEKLKPLLVINKMDRLITELKMSPAEAYTHLSQLLEQVNAVMGSFFQGERMEDDLKWRENIEQRRAAASERGYERAGKTTSVASEEDFEVSVTSEYEEKDDEDIYFAPEKNNVIFGSAIDGWAFTIKQFAGLYEKKLGIKRSVMEKILWGSFYLDPKTKRILGSQHLKGRNLKPMFVQLVLENIWAVYEATTGGINSKGDLSMVEKITKSLSITLPPFILRSRDPKAILKALFTLWLPLSTAVLVSVIEHLPSPPAAQAARMSDIIDASPGKDHIDAKIREAMVTFKTAPGEPIVAYVSKMVAIPESELPENKRKGGGTMTADEARELARKKRAELARVQAQAQAQANAEDDPMGMLTTTLGSTVIGDKVGAAEPAQKEDPEHLIGFARLFSGTLSVGDEVYVLPPKFSPADPHAFQDLEKVKITGLYLLMGRGMESLETVPAGVIFGVAGLAGHVLKSGTLCSQLEGSINLAGINLGSKPIVRVALEPENPSDLDKMIAGLRMLEQSDPCVEYEVLESGEHVILTAGELHLERCLKDLRERFAKCEIQAGEPIVPYRESIVSATEMNPPKNPGFPRGTVVGVITSKQISVRLHVRPLPKEVTEFLGKHAGAIRKFYADRRTLDQDDDTTSRTQSPEREKMVAGLGATEITEPDDILSVADFKKQLLAAFSEVEEDKEMWNGVVERIAAFGPRRVGPNMLIDMTNDAICCRALQESSQHNGSEGASTHRSASLSPKDFADKLSYAFQLATSQGPLMNEHVQGIAVFLEEVTVSIPEGEQGSSREKLGRLTGEVIKTVRESIRLGFLDWSPRVLLAMYRCEVQATAEVLGRVNGVITRRGGRIIAEFMKEGTPFFTIVSLLPVAESFGFSDEIRKRTSGAASPQLIFAGFEMLDQDPFWVPFTEEDLEDLGELADRENEAKNYMDAVRKRKGMFIQGRKLVENAEKQKTMKR